MVCNLPFKNVNQHCIHCYRAQSETWIILVFSMSQEPLLSLQILYLETTMNSRYATMQHRTKTSVELLLSALLQYNTVCNNIVLWSLWIWSDHYRLKLTLLNNQELLPQKVWIKTINVPFLHLVFQIRARTKVGYGENATLIVQGKQEFMHSLHEDTINVFNHELEWCPLQ